jgi:hypothetical protein
VNVPASESNLRSASGDEVRQAFDGSELEIVESDAGWKDAAFGARRAAEATPWVVALILALAIAELLLAAPSRRGGRSEVAEAA